MKDYIICFGGSISIAFFGYTIGFGVFPFLWAMKIEYTANVLGPLRFGITHDATREDVLMSFEISIG
jgi:hypothetical protein